MAVSQDYVRNFLKLVKEGNVD